MKPIPVLGIPHYNRPDLLARCVASIDHLVETLVIVNQGPEPVSVNRLLDGLRVLPFQLITIEHPNAGVAGAWNEIIKLFPGRSPAANMWWLISNNDIEFAPGDLGKMAGEISNPKYQIPNEPLALAYGNHGASWFGITAAGVDAVGLFDENFYPAYLEDCDWSWRAKLAGARLADVPDVHARHGDEVLPGSCTINSDQRLALNNMRTHGGNFQYYREKWGGINGQELFKTPFNRPGLPVTCWTFDPHRRAEQQW